MTSLRQITANQANSAKSTGPNTPEGIDRASGNATKHGLTAHGKPRDPDSAAEFQDRIDSWTANAAPESEFETWLIEVMAIESGRYLNGRIVEAELRDKEARRAETTWELDRAADIETAAKKLGGDPAATLSQLRRSKYGVLWLKGRWEGLFRALDLPDGWNDTERTLALDLAGTPLELRRGRTCVDPFSRGEVAEIVRRESVSNGVKPAQTPQRPIDPTAGDALRKLPALREEEATLYRLGFVETMLVHLSFEAERLEDLDASDRRAALKQISPEVSHELKLLRRYETASFRRFQWAKARWEEIRDADDLPTSLDDESDDEPVGSAVGAEMRRRYPQTEEPGADAQRFLANALALMKTKVAEAQPNAVEPGAAAKVEPKKDVEPVSAAKVEPKVEPLPLVSATVNTDATPSTIPTARSPFAGLRDAVLGVGSLNRRQRRALAQMSPSA